LIDYDKNRKDLQIDREADDFCMWAEEQAAKFEITVDYFFEEFLLD
jgi:hypothetical protein